jgi:hypothetical protein
MLLSSCFSVVGTAQIRWVVCVDGYIFANFHYFGYLHTNTYKGVRTSCHCHVSTHERKLVPRELADRRAFVEVFCDRNFAWSDVNVLLYTCEPIQQITRMTDTVLITYKQYLMGSCSPRLRSRSRAGHVRWVPHECWRTDGMAWTIACI